MNSQVELNVVFDNYDQKSFEGFCTELNEIARKWQLYTKTTSFTISQKKVKRLKSATKKNRKQENVDQH